MTRFKPGNLYEFSFEMPRGSVTEDNKKLFVELAQRRLKGARNVITFNEIEGKDSIYWIAVSYMEED